MVNSYFFITWSTLRRAHKDSMVQVSDCGLRRLSSILASCACDHGAHSPLMSLIDIEDIDACLPQEIERLQQAVSEQREQLDCYQSPDWALKSLGEDTGRQALLPCAAPRMLPLALISSLLITGASIDLQRTSPTYTFKCWVCRLRWFWRTMNPPDTILQVS